MAVGGHKTYVDGKEFNDGYIYNVVFSPDNNKVAFLVDNAVSGPEANYTGFANVGLINFQTGSYTKESLERGPLYNLQFSPDSSTLIKVYQHHVVVGDHVGQEYDEIFPQYSNLIFSPDGSSVGYGARKGHELWWVVDKL